MWWRAKQSSYSIQLYLIIADSHVQNGDDILLDVWWMCGAPKTAKKSSRGWGKTGIVNRLNSSMKYFYFHWRRQSQWLLFDNDWSKSSLWSWPVWWNVLYVTYQAPLHLLDDDYLRWEERKMKRWLESKKTKRKMHLKQKQNDNEDSQNNLLVLLLLLLFYCYLFRFF